VPALQVAVVGTGASAIQAIPKLQQTARELVVFQVCAV
jgi:cation diffusion facilitator CzcD-associated flavoprotein CzcO